MRWWIGLGTTVALAGCTGDKGEDTCVDIPGPGRSDADTDTDTDTDTDADTDTDTDVDTGAATRDGTYAGTLTAEVTELGFTDTCNAPISVVIDTTLTPAIQGSGSCAFAGMLTGNTIEITFDGDITEPEASGFASVTYPAMGSQADQWSGNFPDAETLRGVSTGSWPMGTATVQWDIQFNVSR